jgi:uncharacterized membrane protein
MSTALRYLHLLALVIWVGGVVFFSFVTAPALFGALPRDMAGRATAAIFPRYYALGAVCGSVAILTSLVLRLFAVGGSRMWIAQVLLLAVMIGLTLVAGLVILPEASRLRLALPALEGTPEHDVARARFGALHGRSVALNGIVLLLGLGAVFLASLPVSAAGGTAP